MSDRPEMDESAKKGVQPGKASGAVKSYNAKRNPFGGYITDESGNDIFVHKSAVESAGMGKLEKGQKLGFTIVEDGFGGFKAEQLNSED